MKSEGTVKVSRGYSVQALERALDILRCFTFETRELSLAQIAERTGLNKTTAKRLAANLQARGFLRQEQRTKRYRLGLVLFELGGIVYSSFSVRDAARPHMEALHEKTGATVLLGVMMDDQLVYIDNCESYGVVHVSPRIGSRKPLHHGMLGMILMAYLDGEETARILEKQPLQAHTPYSLTDKHAFLLQLEKIRAQGYVLEKEEAYEGVVGIAAPIRDYSRKVVAALGVGMYMGRPQQAGGFSDLAEQVKHTCQDISADLGYLLI